MKWGGGKEIIGDVVIMGGLIGVQVIYAGNSVLLSYLMGLGVYPLSIIIFCTLATFLVLFPVAVVAERHKWPKKLTKKLLVQILLISSCGVTLFQCLFLTGIGLTSPAVATAMPNLVPGLVFLIAWACRFEQVDLSCIYSRVKIVATLICVVGAVTMSVMHKTNTAGTDSAHSDSFFDKKNILGGLCLISGVLVLSGNVVLQAYTLGDFPAPMTLCAVTSLIGSLLTALVELVQDHHLTISWPLLSFKQLIGYSLLAGTVGGICVSFNGWAMRKRGPVLVSMFNPIAAVISIFLSAVALKDTISLGSLGGMCVMFTGLYLVLWAKSKEPFVVSMEEIVGSQNEAEAPLLA